MTAGTPYIPDTIAHAVGSGTGVHQELSAAQITTKYGSGNIKTPTKNFTMHIDGNVITGRTGVPLVLSTELAAKLVAAGAPVV